MAVKPLSYLSLTVFLFVHAAVADTTQSDPIFVDKHTVKSLDRLGIKNFNVRFYDPVAARFISPDPIAATNLYAYAKNNPLAFIDPTGKAELRVTYLATLQERALMKAKLSAAIDWTSKNIPGVVKKDFEKSDFIYQVQPANTLEYAPGGLALTNANLVNGRPRVIINLDRRLLDKFPENSIPLLLVNTHETVHANEMQAIIDKLKAKFTLEAMERLLPNPKDMEIRAYTEENKARKKLGVEPKTQFFFYDTATKKMVEATLPKSRSP